MKKINMEDLKGIKNRLAKLAFKKVIFEITEKPRSI
jgi:hypothetical protein